MACHGCGCGVNLDTRKMEPTLVKGIILSDSVIREHGTGKLSLIGCFTTYNFQILPSVAQPFVVTVFLTNLEGRLETFPITVRIEAPDSGHVLASSMAHLSTDIEASTDRHFRSANRYWADKITSCPASTR